MEEANFNNLKSHKGKKIKSYSIGFKIKAIEYAKKNTKEGTARKFGVDARRIRDWCNMEGKLMAEYELGSAGSERKRLKGAGRRARRQTAPKRQADPPHNRSRQSLGRKIQTLLGSSCSDEEEPSQLFAPIDDSDIESSDMDSMDHSFREDEATSAGFKQEPQSIMIGREVFDEECVNFVPPPMELPTMTPSPAPPTGVVSTAAEATNRKDKGTPPALDPASFWRSCNVAGCTQAIFVDLIMEISNISTRIQSHQASQEDYDTALKVMMASGKLPQLVKKQQNALRGKQIELQRSLEAMQEVESALRR